MPVDIELLRNKVPFKKMPDKGLIALSKVAYTTEHQMDEVLFNIGDTDNYTAYLIKGCVSLESIDGRREYLCHDHAESQFSLANLKPRMYKGRIVKNHSILLWLASTIIEQFLLDSYKYQEKKIDGLSVYRIV